MKKKMFYHGESGYWPVAASLFALCLITLFNISLTSGQTIKGEVLNVGLYNDVRSLDPHAADVVSLSHMLDNIYEPLVDMNNELTGFMPKLATSWKISEDGLTYAFNLRKGVKFSDGTPFNAEAVKLSIDRIKAIKKLAYHYARPIKEVQIIDDYTVAFKLDAPYLPLLAALRFVFMVSPAAVKKYEVKGDWAQNWLNENTAGTGAYKLSSWTRGVKLTLKANEYFWRGWKPNQFTTLNLMPIYESDTQRLMVEKGDLDVAFVISVDALADMGKNPKVKVYEHHGDSIMYIFLNTAAPPTNDVRVRKALAHSWNGKLYAEMRKGRAVKADSPTPGKLLGPAYKVENPYDFNIEKAKKLLAEAGYPKGGLHLKVLSQKGDEEKKVMYEVLQSELAKLGITTELELATWPAMISRVAQWGAKKDPKEAYHLAIFFQPITFFSPYFYLHSLFHSDTHLSKGGGQNYGYYSDAKYDEVVNKAISELDPKKQTELWRKANQMIIKDVPAIWIDEMVEIVVTRSDVKGWYFKPGRSYNDWYNLTRAN